MNSRPTFRICLLALLSLAAPALQAAVVAYTDRISWQADAGGGGAGDIVDDMNSGPYTAAALNRGSYVITGEAYGFFPNGNPVNAIDGSGYLRLFLDGTNDTTFTFSSPVTAFGFDVHPDNFNLSGPTILIAIDGADATSYTLPMTNVNGFRGFVSDTPFTSFTLTTADDALHGIDNFEAYTAAVPEPTRSMLLFFGVSAFLLRRRR
ncbi:MAG: PEP-CTERM sorting domain-containing protein [Prosthecobacter sp.]